MTPPPTGLTLSRRLLALLPWLILALGLGATDVLRQSARQDTAHVLVSADGRLPDPAFREMKTLALTVSKSIKLALTNLRLREALQEQACRDRPTDH